MGFNVTDYRGRKLGFFGIGSGEGKWEVTFGPATNFHIRMTARAKNDPTPNWPCCPRPCWST
jgi:hypothetical protein